MLGAYFERAIGLYLTGSKIVRVHKTAPLLVLAVVDIDKGKPIEVVTKQLREPFLFAAALDEYSLKFRKPDGSQVYSFERLNKKLEAVVRAGTLMSMVPEYEALLLQAILYAPAMQRTNREPPTPWSPRALLGVFSKREVDERLGYMEGGFTGSCGYQLNDPASIATVARDFTRNATSWFSARDLAANPVAVWGAARMAEFFDSDELPQAAKQVRSLFGVEHWMMKQAGSLIGALYAAEMKAEATALLMFVEQLAHEQSEIDSLNEGLAAWGGRYASSQL